MKYSTILFGDYVRFLNLIVKKNKEIVLCSRRNFEINNTNFPIFNHLRISSKFTEYNIKSYFSQIRNVFVDYIIAIGGGSVIDLAKFIKLELRNKYKNLSENIKLIVVPTTFSSAESSKYAFVYSNDYFNKYYVSDEYLIPDYIIIDKNLSSELNFDLSFFSSICSLSNLIQVYFSEKIVDIDVISAISLFFDSIEEAITNKNPDARENLHICSVLSGIAMSQLNEFPILHLLAINLETIENVSYGEAISAILPIFLEYYKDSPEYRHLLKVLNFDLMKKLNLLYDKFNIYSKIKNLISEKSVNQLYERFKYYRIKQPLFDILERLKYVRFV